ncbi:MAG: hypothetical protein HW380_68 [Magnetococcales bacterium]|nr:hypothetical protein [Magnetococcales bacterium]HIJ84768.1 hypothetical protein [Magnetococcales bacterium]
MSCVAAFRRGLILESGLVLWGAGPVAGVMTGQRIEAKGVLLVMGANGACMNQAVDAFGLG